MDKPASMCCMPCFAQCPSLYTPPLSGAHTDYGMLTLLATDDVPGLQLHLPAAGGWVDAKPLPGTFIVNLGDMLERYEQQLDWSKRAVSALR